jgi:hypothetical protein
MAWQSPGAVPAKAPILRLKVTLRDVRPSVWRRVEVPADLPLAALHDVLQAAMGWTDSHLHQFVQGETRYGPAHVLEDVEDERRVTVGDVLRRARQRITYEYDFGDGWEHDVVLEARVDREPRVRYPRVVAGERACPPEDVGGAWGYADFLEAIADPAHPEHEDMVEWCGGGFDPEAFDLARADRLVRRAVRR